MLEFQANTIIFLKDEDDWKCFIVSYLIHGYFKINFAHSSCSITGPFFYARLSTKKNFFLKCFHISSWNNLSFYFSSTINWRALNITMGGLPYKESLHYQFATHEIKILMFVFLSILVNEPFFTHSLIHIVAISIMMVEQNSSYTNNSSTTLSATSHWMLHVWCPIHI